MVPTSLPTQSSMSSQKSYDLIGSTAPDPSKISGGPSQLASELAWVLYASRVVKKLDLCMLLVHVICIVNLQTCIHIGLFEAAITAFDDLWDTKLIWTNMNKIEFVNGLVGYYSSSILSLFSLSVQSLSANHQGCDWSRSAKSVEFQLRSPSIESNASGMRFCNINQDESSSLDVKCGFTWFHVHLFLFHMNLQKKLHWFIDRWNVPSTSI